MFDFLKKAMDRIFVCLGLFIASGYMADVALRVIEKDGWAGSATAIVVAGIAYLLKILDVAWRGVR